MNETWPDGFEWLTDNGKTQMYDLGHFIGQRYRSLINPLHYDHRRIVVESSAKPRCIMSAQCCLAGLFPPRGSQVWTEGLDWQPIPVVTIPSEDDNTLGLSKICRKWILLYIRAMLVHQRQFNESFTELIANKSGIHVKTLIDVMRLADTLLCERDEGISWSNWVNDAGVWEKIYGVYKNGNTAYTASDEMIRFKGGPLLKKIIGNMHAYIKAAKRKELGKKFRTVPKVYMYSAHDVTVQSLFAAMGIRLWPIPPAALAIVELHKIGKKYKVKSYYKKVHRKTPELRLTRAKGCSRYSGCSFRNFMRVTAKFISDRWEQECRGMSREEYAELRQYMAAFQ